ncbi:MAG: hypothetical protein VB013_08205 [Anaerolineaceae bacterium]|nr:hypothetical protein [Anaerolineaceae bacterium]
MNNLKSILTHNGEIEIRTNENELLWVGKPLSISVNQIISIPSSTDFIVLLNGLEANEKRITNLIRLTCLGIIVWQVEFPKSNYRLIRTPKIDDVDIYTGVSRIENGLVYAYSCLGYSDRIDLITGKILSSDFVK